MLEPTNSLLFGTSIGDAALSNACTQVGTARSHLAAAAILLSFISLLSACTQDVILRGSNVAPVARGRLTINVNPPHFIDVDLDGQPYHGEWRSVPMPAAAGDLPDRTSRQYQRIASGMDPWPIVEVSSMLAAPNAPPLKCEWIRRYGYVDGSCSLPDGRVWQLRIP